MLYLKKIAPILLVAIASLATPPAFAEGTNAGVPVTNNVTLRFTVNSVQQTTSATVQFTVDRKLALEVATQNSDWVSVVPGQSDTPGSVGALDYLVSNNSNDDTDVVISLIDRAVLAVTGFTAFSGTPGAFAPTPATGTVWNDLNDNDLIDGSEQSAALDPSGVTELAIGNLTEDQETNVKVVVDVDGAAGADEYRTFTLVAAAANGATALAGDDSGNAAPGGSSTSVADDKDTEQVVFADTDSANSEDIQYNFVASTALGTTDAQYDGQSADSSGFITVVALAVAKHVVTLYDPITENGFDGSGVANTNNPKAIPGAVLLYVVGVVNSSALPASSVLIDDDVQDGAAEVLVGDQANPTTAISIPAQVTFNVGGNATTFNLDRTNIATDLDSAWAHGCQAANASAVAFAGGDPEIDDASLGTCAAGEQGYVAYLVTINDAP